MSCILASVVSRTDDMLSDEIPGSLIDELLNEDDFSNEVVINTKSNVNNDISKPMKSVWTISVAALSMITSPLTSINMHNFQIEKLND